GRWIRRQQRRGWGRRGRVAQWRECNGRGCAISAAGVGKDPAESDAAGPLAPLALTVSVLAFFRMRKKDVISRHLTRTFIKLSRWCPAPQGKSAPSDASAPGSNHPV